MGVTDSDIPKICDEQLLLYIEKHNMKQAAFVVLGIVVSVVLYALLCFFIIEGLLHMSGCAGMVPAFLIMMPVSLVAGGMVTGFLIRPLLNTKLGLIWIAPGLYLGGIMMIAVVFSSTFFDVVAGEFEYLAKEILHMSLSWLFLYLPSLAGTGLGYFLRGLLSPRRKSE